jgi:hypothetical protein
LVERILGKALAPALPWWAPLVERLLAISLRVTDRGPDLRHVFLIGLQQAGTLGELGTLTGVIA